MSTPTITRIESFRFCIGWVNWVFVRIEASDGCYGWGEASLHGPIRPVLAAIDDYATHLVGQEATGAERHWHRLYNAWRWRGGAVYMSALSGIDIALWDMEARRLGVPLHRLFGGPHRTSMRAYASHWLQGIETPQQAFDGAREIRRRGFSAFKWCPFQHDLLRNDPVGSVSRVGELMAAAREGAGQDAEIFIECAELLSPRSAPAMLEALRPHRPGWIEEPFPFENAKAIAQLQQSTDIPVAVGERLLSRYEFRELLELGGCRIVQPDLMHGGGFTELRRIAALAETYQVSVAPHNPGGPLCTAASIQLAASIPNFLILEQIEPDRVLRNQASSVPSPLADGIFTLPDGVGLGLEPNLEALADYTEGDQPRKERTGSLFY
ncbi:mandelate racemase/muconate lactonizing enzyme family protein [Aureimonas fodinaquatilis]|uniref:Mandelate racemase/muconate lactonizing enzyme family protein n=1 Tax=Aureimonas fodinaquatilis TaxID=2565783 RepID=A0A5B0DTY4_9HYPH|nr:mandelate racemase/muconate lactonizing enzyme family protein [Aureimonas fodinaquatilis]KAA0969020.1 mandelate racemase/muconate lactonizing enzyme family protein [Aureimonas fodinaquatilis]